MATTNQLRSAGLREVWVAGLSPNVDQYLAKTIALINKAIRSGIIKNYTERQLDAMVRRLSSDLDDNLLTMFYDMEDEILDLSVADVESELYSISSASGQVAVAPTTARVRSAVKGATIKNHVTGEVMSSKKVISKLNKTNVNTIDGLIRSGYAHGFSNVEISKTIVGTRVRPADGSAPYYSGGYVPNAHKRDVTSTVRTLTASMSRGAREEVWRANKSVIKYVEFVATLDNRTTSICMATDGKISRLDNENRPRPPLHWNCRSAEVPVVRGHKPNPNDPDENRISRGAKEGVDEDKITSDKVWQKKTRTTRGEVPAGTSFDEFLRGNYKGGEAQPVWYIEELLGKGRTQLYLQDKNMSVKNLINADGKKYTLKQLREKYERSGVS